MTEKKPFAPGDTVYTLEGIECEYVLTAPNGNHLVMPLPADIAEKVNAERARQASMAFERRQRELEEAHKRFEEANEAMAAFMPQSGGDQ